MKRYKSQKMNPGLGKNLGNIWKETEIARVSSIYSQREDPGWRGAGVGYWWTGQ